MPSPSADRQPVHLTLKWPAAPGLGLPEVMVNLYGANADELAPHLAEVAALVIAFTPSPAAPSRQERAQRPPAEQLEAPKPLAKRLNPPETDNDEFGRPACFARTCDRYGEGLIPSSSKWAAAGDLYCPGLNDAEADGYCRVVLDSKGLRRKATRAEIDAERAARDADDRPARATNGHRQ